MYIFADDAEFYRRIEHPEDQEFLQLAINALHQWSKEWTLSLNSNKCQVVSYGRTFIHPQCLDQNQQLRDLKKLKTLVYIKYHMHEKNKA